MYRPLVLLFALAGCPEPEPETSPDESSLASAITEDALMAHLDELQAIALDNDATRVFLSGGYDGSIGYIQQTLEDAGYDVQIEEFPITSFSVESVSVSVDGSPADPLDSIDTAVLTFSASGTVTAPLTAVDLTLPPGNANSSTSGCEASDFDGFPAGNIALVQRGTCTFSTKVDNAAAAGASAVIVFNEGQQGRRSVVEGQLDEAGSTIPAVGIDFEDGNALAERGATTVTVDVATSFSSEMERNILVTVPGGDPDRTVLVGAHLDSVIAGPGINDNGSGSAFLLELAVQMAETGFVPANQIQLAWWGAEEEGLVGSYYHFYDDNGEPDEAVLGPLEAYLNFDMIASGNGIRMVYDGDGSDFDGGVASAGSAEIEALFDDYFDAEGLSTREEALLIPSDSYWPALLGVPTGGLFSGAFGVMSPTEAGDFGGTAGTEYDPCYHQSCDRVANTNSRLFEELARAGAAVIEALATREDPLPTSALSRGTPRYLDAPRPRGCHDHVIWDR